jgi:hydrogenase-4 component F
VIGFLTVLLPAVGAPVVRLKSARSGAVSFLVLIAVSNAAVSAWLAVSMAPDATAVMLEGFFIIDATSRLFLLLVNLVVLGIATYIWSRVRAEPALRDGIERYVGFTLAFVAAGNLAVLSNHLLALWIFLEATTLAAVPLIQHGGHVSARRASWKYFLFSGVGLALAFLGFACISRSIELTGTNEVTFFLDRLAQAVQEPNDLWRRLGLVLVFLGFGTKLGLAPMYSWLPETYDAAPPATTALLAAAQFNIALVGVLRVLQVFRAADQYMVSMELVGLGLATMAVSAFNVIAAKNYKKLIAYAALNHGGVIAIGLGIGKGAAYGVVLYAISNAFIKVILFLTAGKIRSHYKTEQISGVSGLIKDLPYSGLFFMVGTFALLGFPPFGSFLGELIIMSGLVGGGYFLVFAAFCMILTVTFVATGRAIFPMIWGEPKKKADRGSQPIVTILPKLVFLIALIAMGLYLPPSVNSLFRQVAAGLGAP